MNTNPNNNGVIKKPEFENKLELEFNDRIKSVASQLYQLHLKEKLPVVPEKLIQLAVTNSTINLMDAMVQAINEGYTESFTIPLSKVPITEVELLPVERLKIPRGEITFIAGDPGRGKSFVAFDVVAELTRSGHKALVLCEDASGNTVRPRIEAMGGDTSRVEVLKATIDGSGGTFPLKSDMPKLHAMTYQAKPDVIVLDPLASFTGGIDTFRGNDLRSLLDPVVALAWQQNIAVVCILHLNKSTGTAIQRLADSMQGVATCRSAYVAAYDPANRSRFVIAHAKANQVTLGPSYGYRIVETEVSTGGSRVVKVGKLVWEDEVSIDADTLLTTQYLPDVSNATKTEIAEVILRSRLNAGPCSKAELVTLAEGMEVAPRTLERAAKKLGIVSKSLYGSEGKETAVWALDVNDINGTTLETEQDQPLNQVVQLTSPQDGLAARTLEKIDQKIDKLLNWQENFMANTPKNGSRQEGVLAIDNSSKLTIREDDSDVDLRYVYPPGCIKQTNGVLTRGPWYGPLYHKKYQ